MVLKGKRKTNDEQQRARHSRAQQHRTIRPRSTTGDGRGQQGTMTQHTTQQGSTSAPQNAKGNSEARSNAPQHEAPETAQTKPATNSTTQRAQPSTTHTAGQGATPQDAGRGLTTRARAGAGGGGREGQPDTTSTRQQAQRRTRQPAEHVRAGASSSTELLSDRNVNGERPAKRPKCTASILDRLLNDSTTAT